MPTAKKILNVQNLAEKFKNAVGIILSDYSGLKVNQISELRREIKKTGAEFEVVKNSLLALAAKAGLPRKFAEGESLRGPTAALWIYQEDFSPLKALDTFIKKTELPKIKLGFWQGESITIERIKELASLPSLEQLQAKLVGTLQSPLFRLQHSLSGNLGKLIMIIKILSTKS